MIFTSDNWAGAHPAIAASLSAHSTGFAPAEGPLPDLPPERADLAVRALPAYEKLAAVKL